MLLSPAAAETILEVIRAEQPQVAWAQLNLPIPEVGIVRVILRHASHPDYEPASPPAPAGTAPPPSAE